MKILLYILLILSFTSCKIVKDKEKRKSSTVTNADIKKQHVIETKITRDGGHIRNTVYYPLFKSRKKDSIVISKSGSARQTIIYRKDGGLDVHSDCDKIEEFKKEILSVIDKTKISEDEKWKEFHKEEKANNAIVLYVVIGLVLVAIFFIWYTGRGMKSVTKEVGEIRKALTAQ